MPPSKDHPAVHAVDGKPAASPHKRRTVLDDSSDDDVAGAAMGKRQLESNDSDTAADNGKAEVSAEAAGEPMDMDVEGSRLPAAAGHERSPEGQQAFAEGKHESERAQAADSELQEEAGGSAEGRGASKMGRRPMVLDESSDEG